jgi:hypothetical protein
MRYKCKLFTLNNELIDGDAECEFYTIMTRRRTTTRGKIYFSKSVPVIDNNFPSDMILILENGQSGKIVINPEGEFILSGGWSK